MLKKMVFAMVALLVTASLANAGLVYSITGPTSVAQNGQITLNLVSSGANIVGFDLTVGSSPTSLGALGNFSITATNSTDNAITSKGGGVWEIISDNGSGGSPPLGTALASFTFTAGNTPGVAIIGLTNIVSYGIGWSELTPTLQGAQVTITPEPATLALLGLGGLLLRRSRKSKD